MKTIETSIRAVEIVEPDVFGDERGWFCEQYNEARYRAAGINAAFGVQSGLTPVYKCECIVMLGKQLVCERDCGFCLSVLSD